MFSNWFCKHVSYCIEEVFAFTKMYHKIFHHSNNFKKRYWYKKKKEYAAGSAINYMNE